MTGDAWIPNTQRVWARGKGIGERRPVVFWGRLMSLNGQAIAFVPDKDGKPIAVHDWPGFERLEWATAGDL